MGRPRINARAAALPVGAARTLPSSVRHGIVNWGDDGLPLGVEWRFDDGTVHVGVDLGFLSRAPGIARSFAEHLAARYTTKSSTVSASTTAEQVRYGLVPYLDHDDRRHLGVLDLDVSHIASFEIFVGGMDVADATKHHRWDGAGGFLRACPGAVRLPPSRWKGSRCRGKANALSAVDLRRVLAAAAEEATLTMARFDAQFDRAHPQRRVAADADHLKVLGDLRGYFMGPFPKLPAIKAKDPDLWRAVSRIGWYELRTWWGPTTATTAPFLVLWLYWFRLNPSMAQTMLGGQVDLVDGEWVVVKGKPRSGRRQTPGYPDGDEPLGPRRVLEFMRRWTEDVRKASGPKERGLLFLLWARPGAPPMGISSRGVMGMMFDGFRERHRIPALTAQMLRPSAIDVVGELTGDHPDYRRATGQHTALVNERSYRAPAADVRDRLRIGTMQMVRRRDQGAHPSVSRVGRVGHGGHEAATPGWTCDDPLNRRFSTSPPGEMCNAVGRCAGCHLGRPVLDSGYSLAHCYALLEAALAEVASGRPERMGMYAPIVDRLETWWIPAFTEAAVASMPAAVPSLRGCLS